ncbi:hypothetical protein [Nocardiopsis halotolerans]|uniref:hypothetical protein n=1 Tax=Nocardiopsis halotolerans TaxID=124252 RepID=UPI0003471190|nr:hypothetical protein [Nocardiopsis halotolerans]
MSVHSLDLRGTTADEALRRVRRTFGEGTPLTDSDRALILDETDLLVDHGPAYEEVFIGGRVRSLVCVVSGAPSDGGDGHRVLERPGPLGPERGVATLWVSDETGVDWGLRPPGAPRPHPDAAHGSRTGVEHLVEVLRQAEVFDRVIEISREVPEAAASPGLSWVGPGGGDEAVSAALTRAVYRLTAPVNGGPAPSNAAPAPGTGPRGGLLVDLVEGTHRVAPGNNHPGSGELAGHESRLRDGVAGAEGALDAISGWGGVFSVSPARVREEGLAEVSADLSAYRDRVEFLLRRLNSLNGEQLASELARVGIDGHAPGPEEVDEAVGALARRVERDLERGTALTHVAADLDRVAERVSPQGSASAVPRARQAAPDHLISSLNDPPPFPLPGPVSGLLPVAFLLPLLPALTGGWPGLAGAIALALGWVAALAVGFRSARGAEAGLPVLATHAVAAFAGGFVGLWLGGAPRPDPLFTVLPQPLLLVAALLVGAALGTYVFLRTWSAFARRWRGEIGLERVDSAASSLTALVNEVAREEWYPGTERRRLADAARAAASAARAVADALSEATTPASPPSAHAPELESVLHGDLAALARAALEPLWSGLRSGVPVGDPYQGTRDRAADLLEEYRSHLARVGPHTPPRFTDAGTPRRVHDGSGLDRALRTLRMEPGERMLQLCDPKHLRLLGDAVSSIGTVRFAPKSLREQLSHDGDRAFEAAQTTVWTHGGRLAGIMRLVPLRPGVVRTQWFVPAAPRTRAEAESPEEHERNTAAEETGAGDGRSVSSPFEEDYLR